MRVHITGVSLVVLVLISTIWGQAPIPRALAEAKTAYLVNESGDLNRFDSLARALKKWGRLKFAVELKNADIVIVFGKELKGTYGTRTPDGAGLVSTVYLLTLRIRDRATGDPLWQDSSTEFGASGRLVKRLRERLEKKNE